MRKLKIMEHISLDGVIQVAGPGDDSDFPYGDWTAPYRTPAGLEKVLAMYGEDLRSVAWPPNLRSVVGFLAEGTEESDGGPPECGDEVCCNPQAGEPGMGPVRGRWARPRGERSRHQGEGRCRSDPLGKLDADFGAARAWACG